VATPRLRGEVILRRSPGVYFKDTTNVPASTGGRAGECRNGTRMKSNSGFTLIELILVTVIIGILAGMVVVTFGGRVQESQIRTAKGDIMSLSTAIDLYALDHNDTYPPTLAALTEAVNGRRNYVKELRNDPWGNPYNYKPATSALKADYEVWSSGPDGIPGNEDDVTSSSPME